jgi:hypothetical protein
MLELEGTVKRWDEVQAEAERLTALIRRYDCNPFPPHRVRAAGGTISVTIGFQCFDPFKELLVKTVLDGNLNH